MSVINAADYAFIETEGGYVLLTVHKNKYSISSDQSGAFHFIPKDAELRETQRKQQSSLPEKQRRNRREKERSKAKKSRREWKGIQTQNFLWEEQDHERSTRKEHFDFSKLPTRPYWRI